MLLTNTEKKYKKPQTSPSLKYYNESIKVLLSFLLDALNLLLLKANSKALKS